MPELLPGLINSPRLGVVPHHRSANAAGHVVSRSMHQMTVEHQQIAGLHQDRHRFRHVVIDDFCVAVLRMRAPVRHMLWRRLEMRAGHHMQASIVERSFGDGQPDSDLRPRAEREVVRILMPRLSERAMIFENELADEAVEFRSDQIANYIDHRRILGELFENWIAMQPENFADVVLGVSCKRVGFLFRQYEYVWNPLTGDIEAANLDHARIHRAAVLSRREATNDEEARLIPVALLFSRKHRACPPAIK